MSNSDVEAVLHGYGEEYRAGDGEVGQGSSAIKLRWNASFEMSIKLASEEGEDGQRYGDQHSERRLDKDDNREVPQRAVRVPAAEQE